MNKEKVGRLGWIPELMKKYQQGEYEDAYKILKTGETENQRIKRVIDEYKQTEEQKEIEKIKSEQAKLWKTTEELAIDEIKQNPNNPGLKVLVNNVIFQVYNNALSNKEILGENVHKKRKDCYTKMYGKVMHTKWFRPIYLQQIRRMMDQFTKNTLELSKILQSINAISKTVEENANKIQREQDSILNDPRYFEFVISFELLYKSFVQYKSLIESLVKYVVNCEGPECDEYTTQFFKDGEYMTMYLPKQEIFKEKYVAADDHHIKFQEALCRMALALYRLDPNNQYYLNLIKRKEGGVKAFCPGVFKQYQDEEEEALKRARMKPSMWQRFKKNIMDFFSMFSFTSIKNYMTSKITNMVAFMLQLQLENQIAFTLAMNTIGVSVSMYYAGMIQADHWIWMDFVCLLCAVLCRTVTNKYVITAIITKVITWILNSTVFKKCDVVFQNFFKTVAVNSSVTGVRITSIILSNIMYIKFLDIFNHVCDALQFMFRDQTQADACISNLAAGLGEYFELPSFFQKFTQVSTAQDVDKLLDSPETAQVLSKVGDNICEWFGSNIENQCPISTGSTNIFDSSHVIQTSSSVAKHIQQTTTTSPIEAIDQAFAGIKEIKKAENFCQVTFTSGRSHELCPPAPLATALLQQFEHQAQQWIYTPISNVKSGISSRISSTMSSISSSMAPLKDVEWYLTVIDQMMWFYSVIFYFVCASLNVKDMFAHMFQDMNQKLENMKIFVTNKYYSFLSFFNLGLPESEIVRMVKIAEFEGDFFDEDCSIQNSAYFEDINQQVIDIFFQVHKPRIKFLHRLGGKDPRIKPI